mmetsp:Transcript_16488/g.39359  ORF Transcript_16488/g.39359 Transcript_16488/m.39359 type:complete len:236 (+) Transcript_16488:4901-5608(+)
MLRAARHVRLRVVDERRVRGGVRVVRVVGLASLEIAMGHLGLCGRLDAAEHVEARVVELRAVRLGEGHELAQRVAHEGELHPAVVRELLAVVELDRHECLLCARDDLGYLDVLHHIVLVAVARPQLEHSSALLVDEDVHLAVGLLALVAVDTLVPILTHQPVGLVRRVHGRFRAPGHHAELLVQPVAAYLAREQRGGALQQQPARPRAVLALLAELDEGALVPRREQIERAPHGD